MATIDWSNACARSAALRDAYYRLVSGAQEVEISTRTNDAEERVKFSPANIGALKAEMTAADEACQRANGLTPAPRRFAMRLGATRRFGPWGRGC